MSLSIALACLFVGGLPAEVEFDGNLVLNDSVYRSILEVSAADGLPETTDFGVWGTDAITDFLLRSGYGLASVSVSQEGGRYIFHIDEGQLDKIIFPGVGSWQAIRLQFELALPSDVFNRHEIERQLSALAETGGFLQLTYSLVPAARVSHQGLQIEPGPGFGPLVLDSASMWELHIHGKPHPWPSGFGLRVAYRSPDGLTLGVGYRSHDLLFRDDRWQAQVSLSGRIQDFLTDNEGRNFLSNAQLSLRWQSPEIAGIRPQLDVSATYANRQRLDLGVVSYHAITVDPALSLEYELDKQISIGLGGGVQILDIVRINTGDLADDPRRPDPNEGVRPFFRGTMTFRFEPSQVRRDSLHIAKASAVHFFAASGQKSTSLLKVDYENTILFGYDELRYSIRGAVTAGYIAYTDEYRVSDFVRAVDGRSHYTGIVGSGMLEYRLSLYRDDLKISAYNDVAVFRSPELGNQQDAIVADGFGVGVHVMFLDAFQLNVYYGGALTSEKAFTHGLALEIKQSF